MNVNSEDAQSAWRRLLDEELPSILRALRGSDVEELEIADGERLIRIKLQVGTASALEKGSAGEVALTEAGPPQLPEEAATVSVKSNRVGTFYRAAGGHDSPLRSESDTVAKGDPIGYIDSLNIMHELAAPEAGAIVRFTVADGQDVEYGQEIAVIGLPR